MSASNIEILLVPHK